MYGIWITRKIYKWNNFTSKLTFPNFLNFCTYHSYKSSLVQNQSKILGNNLKSWGIFFFSQISQSDFFAHIEYGFILLVPPHAHAHTRTSSNHPSHVPCDSSGTPTIAPGISAPGEQIPYRFPSHSISQPSRGGWWRNLRLASTGF